MSKKTNVQFEKILEPLMEYYTEIDINDYLSLRVTNKLIFNNMMYIKKINFDIKKKMNINYLNKSLIQLKNNSYFLTELNLSHIVINLNNINIIKYFKNIEKLILNHCNLNDKHILSISHMYKLIKLSLKNNSIINIHSDIIKLCKLEYLDLQDNKLININEIYNIKSLKYLNLTNNLLCNEVNRINKLINLQDLYISNCFIHNDFNIIIKNIINLDLSNNVLNCDDILKYFDLVKNGKLKYLNVRSEFNDLSDDDILKITNKFNKIKLII